MSDQVTTRIEHDMLGELHVPAAVYWGIHTRRAMEHCPLAGRRIPAPLIAALARVKRACAMANAELGYLDATRAGAIYAACDEIAAGRWLDQFPLDALQGGAGTSTNMNINEVIANRALEIAGYARGRYDIIHPLDDINRHQSTNDIYPTAVKAGLIAELRRLSAATATLQQALQKKEQAFAAIPALGRTEMQAAVPFTLGAEFSTWAEAVARDRWRVFKCEERLRVINLGGTAIGTGITAPRRYIFLVVEKLREVTGMGLARADNLVEQTANADALVEVSGILKSMATSLIKCGNDLRLLNLLGEIRLPPMQAGSSIMPGKVNPVIAEAIMSAGMQVCANDSLVAATVSHGTLQISEFMPVAAAALFDSLAVLNHAATIMAPHVDGITADHDRCASNLSHSPALITALLPRLGYERASELAAAHELRGGDLRQYLDETVGAGVVAEALTPARIMALGHDEPNP